MTEFSNNVEAAAKVAAAIDNGASEASTNVSKNAQTSTEQVNNLQSCAKGHSTDYDDFSNQEAQAVVEESAIKQRMKSKERRKLNRENMGKKYRTSAQRKEHRKAKRRLNYERSHPRVHIDASQDTDNSLNVTIVQEGGNVINAAYPKRRRRTSNASAKASQPKPKSKSQPQSQKNDKGSGETKGIGKTILAIVGLGIFGGVCALIYNKHNRA